MPYKGIRKFVHKILQEPFRRLASKFSSFDQIDKSAEIITGKQNRANDLDVLRQSITLAYLSSLCPTHLNANSTVWIIGDGFASMTSLILANRLAKKVVLVNLTKTLLVDLYYLRLFLGEKKFNKSVKLYSGEIMEPAEHLIDNSEVEFELIAIQASDYTLLNNFEADLVINIASMQEMNPNYIENYFKEIRKASSKNNVLFYCCNRLEKFLPDGTVTRIREYPWIKNDEILTNSLCPWHQKYYKFSIPFYFKYDGPIQHMLVRIANK